MARALAEAFVRVRADGSTFKRDVEKDADKAGRSAGRRFGSAFGSSLGRISKLAVPAATGLLAVGAAASALNTAVQAGTALAPLAGFLAAVPGAAIAAATAMGTLKLATSGLDDAFKAIAKGDAGKLKDALKELPPATRSVLTEAMKLRPVFLSIRNTASQNLFAPLRGQLTALAKTLAGPLKQGVADVAIQFGAAGKQVAEFARQSKSLELVRAAFGNVSFSLGMLRQAINPVLVGLRGFALEGLSFLPQVAASVSKIAQRFGVWLQAMVKSGQATEWIRNALATLKQLGGVLVQVGGIIKSVLSAASAGGSGVIGVLGQALAQLNKFLKTAQGQAALTSIFQGLAAIGQALSPIIAALVVNLGGLAGPIGRLATQLGPVLLTAINAVGPALKTLEPGISALIGGFGQAFQAIAASGALPAIGQAISAIAVAVAPVLPVIAQLAALLAGNLANALQTLVLVFGPVISALTQSLAPILPQLATAFAQLAQEMTPIASQLGLQLGQALSQILPPLLAIIPQLLQGLVPALLDLMTALMPLLPSLTQLAVVLAQNLAQTLPPLIPVLTQLVELMANWTEVMVPVLGWILQISAALAGGLGEGLAVAIRAVADMVNAILMWFRRLFDILLGHSIIPDLVNGMVAWFGSLPSRVVGYFAQLAVGAVTQMGALLSRVGVLAGRIVGVFRNAGSWLVGAGKDIMIGLWNGIASLGGWIASRISSLVRAVIPGPVRRVLGISSPSKVMAELGRYTGQGLMDGMDSTRSGVARTASRLAAAAVPTGPQLGLAGAPGRFGAPAGGSGLGLTAADIADAVATAIQGLGVHMDGDQVGQIVSRRLGRKTDQMRRTG
jgi:phage-related protein